MKTAITMKQILSAGLVATLGFGTAAQARDWNHDGGRQQGRHDHQRHDGHQRGQDRHSGYGHQGNYVQPRHGSYNNYAPQYRSYGYAPQYRSYSYAPRYGVGGYVPNHYRAQRYWVNDWRARRLAPPPYGYQWVQTDTGDVLLMALATGIIASAILAQ